MKHSTPFPRTARDSAMEAEAARNAEGYLADFTQTWKLLSPELQPAALRQAKWSLTIAALSDPLQMEIRLGAVAAAAGLPKSELRHQIEQRVEFFQRFHELRSRNPEEVESALCDLILA